MYFEATANLTGVMLVKVDRMSMANSIEVRCPLLDHKLAEFAMQLPHAWKMRDGKGKAIFIEAFRDRFPPELLARNKFGLQLPLADWLRGPLRPMLEECVGGRKFLGRGIVSRPLLRRLLDEHQRGQADHSAELWSLLVLEAWFQKFDSRPTPRPAIASALAYGL
jgi:asparagine synthase (glutamine-hydrolysing)